MGRLENPVLKRELKDRIRAAKIIPAIFLRFILLGVLCFLILLSRLGKGVSAFLLAETCLILLLTPGSILNAFSGNLRELKMTRLGPGAILLGKLAGASFYNLIIIFLSALTILIIPALRRDLHLQSLIYANLSLLILTFASTMLSLAISTLFRRNIIASATLIYTLTLLLIGSMIIPGPLIARISDTEVKNKVTKVALHANPVIMTSRALGNADIMRTRYMYELADPIVGRGFEYPDWQSIAIIYFAISCFLIVPVYLGFRYLFR